VLVYSNINNYYQIIEFVKDHVKYYGPAFCLLDIHRVINIF